MTWDWPDAQGYEEWFATPSGQFALAQERRLLEYVVAGWPSRFQKLLEVGCGTGLFLEALYLAGFDVTGLDASPAMLDAARGRLGERADFHLGRAEHLPFDDNEFDFAVLWTVLEFCDDPQRALEEAARVASKGVLIGFLNKHSLYYLSHGKPWPWVGRGLLRRARWRSWLEMRRMILAATGRKARRMRSVLPGPVWTWRECPPWRHLNGFVLPPFLGAFAACRVDFVGAKPLTPLLLWTRTPAGQAN